MGKIFDDSSVQEAMRLANSTAGRTLIANLQQQHSRQMQDAMALAAQGDMEAAKNALAACMADPQTQALLRKLQEDRHG